MLLASQLHNRFDVLATASLLLLFACMPSFLQAEGLEQQPPPVFQPHEIQHGFSEFESLPDIPSPTRKKIPTQESLADLKPPIDSDQPPTGLFYHLDFAKGFEEDRDLHRGHFVIPINPSSTLPADERPVFLVFRVHQHFAPYEVFGQLFPEKVSTLDPDSLIDKDAMHLATEDDSGYLQFDPPLEQWPPGTYKVKIFVGFEASQFNLRGTMRFSIGPNTANEK
ncbi:MAG: hypothetical protein ACPGYT_15030 [Nitrospirales bacterium]